MKRSRMRSITQKVCAWDVAIPQLRIRSAAPFTQGSLGLCGCFSECRIESFSSKPPINTVGDGVLEILPVGYVPRLATRICNYRKIERNNIIPPCVREGGSVKTLTGGLVTAIKLSSYLLFPLANPCFHSAPILLSAT